MTQDIFDSMETLELIKAKLIDDGFNGLYYPGECACVVDDLAPCGETQDGGDYINDCHGGYKHIDPKDCTNFCVSGSKEPPGEDEWSSYR